MPDQLRSLEIVYHMLSSPVQRELVIDACVCDSDFASHILEKSAHACRREKEGAVPQNNG